MPNASPGLTLAQIVRPGAPIVYGSFTSNVDMKSGSPAFGTPGVRQGGVRRGTDGALPGLAVALLERDRVEHPGCPVRLRVADEPVGGAVRRLQLRPARGRLAGERPHHLVREVHSGHRDAADVCRGVPAGRRRSPPTSRSRRSPRWAPAAISSAARTPWSAIAARSMRRWSPIGATTAAGRRTAPRRPPSAPAASGSSTLARYVAPARDPAVVEALDAYVARAHRKRAARRP